MYDKIKKYAVIIWVSLIACWLLTGCNEKQIEVSAEELSDVVTYIGIVDTNNDDSINLSWTNSGIEFDYIGSSMTVLLDTEKNEEDSSSAVIGIACDDGEIKKYIVDGTDQQISYSIDNRKAKHKITIMKLSEFRDSKIDIKAISIDGQISSIKDEKEGILFIGDSITCGYGLCAPGKDSPFNVKEEDGSLTYGFKLAQEMDMKGYYLCRRGSGIYKSVGNTTDHAILELYESVKELIPDVKYVIINMGTNDENYILGKESEVKSFEEGYYQLLDAVRKDHKSAQILVCYGAMRNQLSDNIRKVVSNYNQNNSDNIKYVSFDKNCFEVSDGCTANHPSQTYHDLMKLKIRDALD